MSSPRPRRRLRDPFSDLDRRVTLAVRKLHAPGRDRLVHAITFLGSHVFLIPAAILVSGTLILAHRGPAAGFLGGVMLVGWLWSPLLKRRFRRGRPDLWTPLATEATHSFPSGHATMATMFFGALALVLRRETHDPLMRGAILAGAAAVILCVALSRVYLGAHWLSDVLAGILLGLVWIAVWMLVVRSEFTRHSLLVDPRPLQVAVSRGGTANDGSTSPILPRLRRGGAAPAGSRRARADHASRGIHAAG